jgi:hypothetical protein
MNFYKIEYFKDIDIYINNKIQYTLYFIMNREERLLFERDGYVIIKNAIAREDCKELMKESIKPILRKNNLYYTGKRLRKKGLRGRCFGGSNGQPIDGKWPPLFKNKRVNSILGDLHPRGRWQWIYGAKNGLGWIHIRYPYTRSHKWKIPANGWHIDGAKNDNTIFSELSYVVLPLINSITRNGGGTALYKGSHRLINYWIHHLQKRITLDKYIKNLITNEKSSRHCNIVETNGSQGDILIMHPHLIHAPSNCWRNNKIRITFNLATGFS